MDGRVDWRRTHHQVIRVWTAVVLLYNILILLLITTSLSCFLSRGHVNHYHVDYLHAIVVIFIKLIP